MKIHWIAILSAVFLFAIGLQAYSQGPAPVATEPTASEPLVVDSRVFMQAKLAHSQKLLGALAIEDYEAIALHASQLKLISLDANWQVLKTPEYLEHSDDFRKSCALMAEAAESKNVDRAALAYIQVTMSCVNCHKHVRSQK